MVIWQAPVICCFSVLKGSSVQLTDTQAHCKKLQPYSKRFCPSFRLISYFKTFMVKLPYHTFRWIGRFQESHYFNLFPCTHAGTWNKQNLLKTSSKRPYHKMYFLVSWNKWHFLKPLKQGQCGITWLQRLHTFIYSRFSEGAIQAWTWKKYTLVFLCLYLYMEIYQCFGQQTFFKAFTHTSVLQYFFFPWSRIIWLKMSLTKLEKSQQ